MAHLESIIISVAFFAMSLFLVIAILNYLLKSKLIKSGALDPETVKLLGNTMDQQITSLKWGLILLFAGIGLVAIHYIPEARNLESPLPYGIELIFIAIGFIVYYLQSKSTKP